MVRWLPVFFIGLVMIACALTPTIASNPPLSSAPSNNPISTPPPTNTSTPQSLPSPTHAPSPTAPAVPRPDHVVVVIFENHGYAGIIGDACCPYLNQLAKASALMTRSFAVTHPSQPNYLALFSGSNQGVTDDTCPPPGSPFATPNLGQQLLDAGFSFTGFAEDLPDTGAINCSASTYALKHVPWAEFSNVPSEDSQPFSSFPADFSTLPTVSFVTPNLCNDMHDCGPDTGDAWLSSQLDSYVQWAEDNNSLFIVTFDEDDYHGTNQIFTFFTGPMVQPGQYNERINHYNVLRTLEALYGLPYAGQAAHAATITDIWKST